MTDYIRCSYNKIVAIKDLKPNPRNRNNHPDSQIRQLAKILKYQGIRKPVVVSNQSGFVTAGHGRILAAKLNGWEELPVDFQDYDTPDMEYLDVQADNAIALQAELDLSAINLDIGEIGPFDIDLLGLKDFAVEPADKYGDKDADATPERRTTTIAHGDLFSLGNHRLLCGDSTDMVSVERLMNGEKADMVFTDPPYGADIVQGTTVCGSKPFGSTSRPAKNKIIKANSYSPIIGDETTDTAIRSFNTLKDFGRRLVFWGAQYYAEALPASSGWIVWDKDTSGTFGDGELAWTNKDCAVRIFKHTWNGLIKESERTEKRIHPTQKPVALAEYVFKTYDEPKTVLDSFLGSGSTLIACEKTNRKCFGMEIDPQYCQVIIDRWEKFTGQKAVKL